MRKLFACGHRGKGKFCNRCKIEEKQRKIEEEKKAEEFIQKSNRNRIYTTLGRKVGSLPDKLANRAYSLWLSLMRCESIHDMEGWRKLSASTLGHYVVFDLGKGWRLIASLKDDRCRPVSFFSHQEYNTWLSRMVKH